MSNVTRARPVPRFFQREPSRGVAALAGRTQQTWCRRPSVGALDSDGRLESSRDYPGASSCQARKKAHICLESFWKANMFCSAIVLLSSQFEVNVEGFFGEN